MRVAFFCVISLVIIKKINFYKVKIELFNKIHIFNKNYKLTI